MISVRCPPNSYTHTHFALHKGREKKNEVGTGDAASEATVSGTEDEGNKLVIGAAVSEATADGTEDATEGKRLATEAQ